MPPADRPFASGVYLPRIIPFMSGNCISMNRTPSAASSAPIAFARRRAVVVRALREDHRAPWDVNADENRGATSRANRSAQRRCTSRGVPGSDGLRNDVVEAGVDELLDALGDRLGRADQLALRPRDDALGIGQHLPALEGRGPALVALHVRHVDRGTRRSGRSGPACSASCRSAPRRSPPRPSRRRRCSRAAAAVSRRRRACPPRPRASPTPAAAPRSGRRSWCTSAPARARPSPPWTRPSRSRRRSRSARAPASGRIRTGVST